VGAVAIAAQTPATKPALLDSKLRDEVKASVDLGINYLRWKIGPSGSLDGDLAATAMAVRVFAESHRKYNEDDGPFMRQPLAFVRGKAGPDGAFASGPRAIRDTALALLALNAVHVEADRPLIERAQTFLTSAVERHGASIDPLDAALVLEALDPLDPARGLPVWGQLVSRAAVAPESGAVAAASLHGLLLARVDRADPRVTAIAAWIRDHYTLGANPPLGDRERYRYYYGMVNALGAYGRRTFADASGAEHDWRTDLARQLISLQQFDGFWVNGDAHGGEDNRSVATALALHALEVLYNSRL
jgi:hypothetical protein